MIFKAILSNKAHPELGQATIPLPIRDSEYDHTIALLGDMDIGSPTAQDCRVDGLDGSYPILDQLVTQTVNVDELDYLAKRLDSFCQGEIEKFQAIASKLCLSDIKDFINLTFCCQQATVITDFTDLERIGKDHALTVCGDSMPMEMIERVGGRAGWHGCGIPLSSLFGQAGPADAGAGRKRRSGLSYGGHHGQPAPTGVFGDQPDPRWS